ncbi:MAG: NUDIX domain-containing protein [Phycisphaerae bacterium]|nr:NUDIX domain-containing protein [Phycisphaerae bacterium]
MPRVCAELVDVYVFRRAPGVEFLHLRRVGGSMHGTWHPIMGTIEPGEESPACARRELKEEAGLEAGDPAWVGFWALQGVHPYYIARRDAILLTPRFAAEVAAGWAPRLNEEHDAFRWVALADVPRVFMWPGQRAAIDEIVRTIVGGGVEEAAMRLSQE